MEGQRCAAAGGGARVHPGVPCRLQSASRSAAGQGDGLRPAGASSSARLRRLGPDNLPFMTSTCSRLSASAQIAHTLVSGLTAAASGSASPAPLPLGFPFDGAICSGAVVDQINERSMRRAGPGHGPRPPPTPPPPPQRAALMRAMLWFSSAPCVSKRTRSPQYRRRCSHPDCLHRCSSRSLTTRPAGRCIGRGGLRDRAILCPALAGASGRPASRPAAAPAQYVNSGE